MLTRYLEGKRYVRKFYISCPLCNPMCLAIPGKILSIEGNIAKIDYGDGTIKNADISLVEASVGEYVIVHAGFAIQVLDKKEAEETIELFKQILEADNA